MPLGAQPSKRGEEQAGHNAQKHRPCRPADAQRQKVKEVACDSKGGRFWGLTGVASEMQANSLFVQTTDNKNN